MSVGNRQGVVEAVRFDLNKFHETWMELLYPRQRGASDTVLGKWQPQTTREKLTYNVWAALGALVVAVLYPLALFGVVVRFHARKIDVSVQKLGAVGVVLLTILVWGGLSALVEFRLQAQFSSREANAIIAASVVAILSSALAVLFRSVGGRITTVVFAYPFGMTAIFLPPVVAALVSDDIAQFSIIYAEEIAELARAQALEPVGLRDEFADRFDMTEFAYVLIWVGISVPLGWLLGTTVALADFIRPTGE
jgi:signal transduction histidine kinase